MFLFMGKATKDQLSGHTEKIDPICANSFCFDENFTRLERCAELAEKKGCTIPQIAMAYILNAGLDVYPIVGAANKEELQSSIDALDIVLSPEEEKWLDLGWNSKVSSCLITIIYMYWMFKKRDYS